MGKRWRTTIAGAAATLFVVLAGVAADTLRIDWNVLDPSKAGKSSTGGDDATEAPLSWQLAGRAVELSGYLLPADQEGDLVYEFMLVSRPGACSHMAQPPANQVVRVIPETPYRLSGNYEPVRIAGILKPGIEKSQIFVLDGVTVIESGYRVSSARVVRANLPAPAAEQPVPWKFLRK